MLKSCLLVLAACFASGQGRAQVIEIDASGEARTYDGPTLFVGQQRTAIEPARRANASGDARALLAAESRNHGIAPGLLEAVAWQESRGKMSAVSAKGALGVMQLMPGTAAELGVDPTNVADNIRGGALYLRRQLDRFGSVPLALAAYNAGPGAVLRYGGIPPFRETRDYVARIMGRWRPPHPAPTIESLTIEVPE